MKGVLLIGTILCWKIFTRLFVVRRRLICGITDSVLFYTFCTLLIFLILKGKKRKKKVFTIVVQSWNGNNWCLPSAIQNVIEIKFQNLSIFY